MSSWPLQPTACWRRWAAVPRLLAAGNSVIPNAAPMPATATTRRAKRVRKEKCLGGGGAGAGRSSEGISQVGSPRIARVFRFERLRREVGGHPLEPRDVVDVEREPGHDRERDVGVPGGERSRRVRLPALERREQL